MGGTLKWRGKEVSESVINAAKVAINETMADAVAGSTLHGFTNRTGTAEGSVRIAQHAAVIGAMIVGSWGSVGVIYALPLEFGDLTGPWLRASGDREYPKLAGRIREALR